MKGHWRYLCAIAASMMLAPAPTMSQAAAPPELFSFPAGSAGQGAGQLRLPGAIAANADTGNLYVAESENNRTSEFTSEGTFVRSWGWGVVRSGPNNDPHNERQEISLSASGGTLSLVFRNPLKDGGAKVQQTASFGFNASAAEVQAALEALESPVPGDVAVTGPAGAPWTVEFTGKYADTDVWPLEIVKTSLIGTGEVKTLEGGGSFEVCEAVAGDECRAGQYSGTSPGLISGLPRGIAVDDDGNVYTFEQELEEPEPNSRVQKFSPDGAFELMLGGGVNKTTGADICTLADLEAGDECGAGAPGEGPGEFAIEPFGSFETRLVVGPSGNLYVGDKNRIQAFESDGSFKSEIAVSGFVSGIAADAAENLYVTYFGQPNIHKFTSSGLPGAPATFAVTDPHAVAIDSEGGVYTVKDPPAFGIPPLESQVVKFDAAGSKIVPTAAEEAQGKFFAQKGAATLTGLATLLCPAGDPPGALYVADTSSHVSAYGSDPGCEEPPGPKITGRYVAAAGPEGAAIATQINPSGFATTYYVEYGTSPCETSSCTQQPPAPGKSLENEGSSPVLREVDLSGLVPGTTYHYRVVAVGNSITVESEEGTFTTRRPGTGPLPDGRAYEMVSPVVKNSADIAPQGGLSNFLMQAAESGPSLVYPSSTPFADPESAPPSSAYRGTRAATAPEWATKNLPPQGAALEQQVKALSADLEEAAIVSGQPLCCGVELGIKNLYLRDLETGAYTLVTEVEPQLTVPKTTYCVGLQGFTAGFERVFFKANGALTDDAPAGSGWNLYEWTAAEGIGLVSVLPGETPATPASTANFGSEYLNCEPERLLDNAISADGTKAIWTDGSALYARVNGAETVQLDLPQGGPGSGGTGDFWAASEDASKVFFTASSLLTAPNAHAQDLYRYDFNQSLGARLTNLTAGASTANVQGVVGSSDGGDAIYFVARGVLAANEGAAVDPETGDPQKAKAATNNLYLWQEGEGTRFIAQLSPVTNAADPLSDATNWDVAPAGRRASVAADANILAFTSVEPLTGYENTSQADGEPTRQVYLYDAAEDELTCASCNPTNARPLGGAATTAWKTAFTEPRYLSEGGERLFFESFDALVAEDQNDARDVYEFERAGVGDCTEDSPTYWEGVEACIDLVSSGTGTNNFFLDASATGEEAFISTAEQLANVDTDEKYDAYDARIGGEAQVGNPPPPPPCDEVLIPCRDEATPPPPSPGPKTTPPLGSGNVPPPKGCSKGKVRRKGKCVPRNKTCPKGKVRRKGKCVPRNKQSQRQGGRGK